MKRIVTIQDISCVGKCSLTVALPIISACGVETSVIPTAVLSTHTAFSGFTFHDLTSEITPIAAHWKREGIGFDAIYTGYLGSGEQVQLVEDFFRDFGTDDNLIVVDPVMADHGKLYAGFTPTFVRDMAKLCGHADLILPNLTEAAFLLGEAYKETYTEDEVKALAQRLSEFGCSHVILTGVSLREGYVGAMSYSRESGMYHYYDRHLIAESFHGTGDVFASTVVGAMTRGMALGDAMSLAVDFTVECMKRTIENPIHNTYGVDFEMALPMLIERMSSAFSQTESC